MLCPAAFWSGLLSLACLAPMATLAQTGAAPDAPAQTERLRPLDFGPFETALARLQLPPEADAFLRSAGIPEAQAAMAENTLSAESLTLWHLDRIRRLDDGLRGMLDLNPAALHEARASDARRAAGRLIGPLDGIPVTLKDNIATAGPMHTTANAEILLDHVAETDAALVANLRAAGAVIIGKASLSEFAGAIAFGHPSGGSGAVGGQGVNPLGPYPTYGSSSGSAISVAAHYAMASIGTETSGSLVAPAGVMSLVALKPSAGLVSTDGILPLIRGNDGAGPMARSVTDAALLLSAIDEAGVDYTAGLSVDALHGVRVGVLIADMARAGKLSAAMARMGATLSMLGAETVPVTLDDPPGMSARFLSFIGTGLRHDMMPAVAKHAPGITTPEDLIAYNRADPARRMPFGQDLLEIMSATSTGLTEADHARLTAEMTKAMTDALAEAFDAHGGVDVLVGMANRQSPLYATAGYPAITLPIGRRDDGEPVGLTLIGRKGQDARLIGFAFALEQATRAHIAANLP